MNSHATDAGLSAYLKNRLDEADERALLEHLRACSRCQGRLREVEDEQAPRLPQAPPMHAARRWDWLVTARRASEGQVPTIDGYAIDDHPIGRGGMGVVYRATHPRFGVVALKVIPLGSLPDAETVERFHAEAIAAKAISDQSRSAPDRRLAVVEVFEIGERDGVLFISMELAAGGSIEDFLAERRDHPLRDEPREVARLIAPVAESVAAMHRDGRFHRDLKPANILLQVRPGAAIPDPSRPPLEALDPLVADFGLAKRVEQTGRTRTKDLRGTPEYLSPEQVKDGKVADARTDIYALGVTLYRMMTGVLPFEGASTLELLRRISVGYPARPGSRYRRVPAELEAICLKCLEWSPNRRYASAQDLADDLRRYLRGEKIRARGPGRIRRGLGACRKHPAVAAAFAFLALATLASTFAAWGWKKDRDAERIRSLAAEEGRKHAEAVASLEKSAAHAANVSAARTASRRGDWPEALSLYQVAIDDRLGDATLLRSERLFGFFFVNDMPTLLAELSDLDRKPDRGPVEARVALVRGAYLLCNADREQEGRQWVAKALKDHQRAGFSPADVLFARAIASDSPRESLQLLREAVKLDSLHFPAQSNLLVALVANSELAEARTQADMVQGLFPKSAVPAFVRTLIALIEQDRAEVRRHLDDLGRRLGPTGAGEVARLSNYCDALMAILDHANAMPVDGKGGIGFGDILRIGLEVHQLKALAPHESQPLVVPISTVGLLYESFGALLGAIQFRAMQGDEASFEHLMQINRKHPEALILSMAAAELLQMAMTKINGTELDPARDLFVRIADLADRAAVGPTLLIKSPMRYQSRVVCAIADVAWLKITPAASSPQAERMRDHLHAMVVQGRNWPAERRQALNSLLQMIVADLTKEQARDWKLDTPKGLKAFEATRNQLFRYGRNLVEDWLQDEPADAEIMDWKHKLEKSLESKGVMN